MVDTGKSFIIPVLSSISFYYFYQLLIVSLNLLKQGLFKLQIFFNL